MTTLFDNTGLPLWVYILLIVVGSLLLLAAVAILLRRWYARRKPKQGYVGGLTGPTRQMTLRRGRLVPTSQHLSLTGSRFGVRQFGALADNDSMITGRRSPFEWLNTIMDRSQSRQDQMSQVETGSISISTRPTSRATTTAGRHDVLPATPTRTPEKSNEAVSSTWEVTLDSPSPSPSPSPHARKTINFSRSFIPRAPSSPITQRSQQTLSRISERSPQHSMISTNDTSGTNKFNFSSYQAPIDLPIDQPSLTAHPQSKPSTASKSMTLAVPVASVKRSPTLSLDQLKYSPPLTSIPWVSNRLNASAASLFRRTPSPTNQSRPFTADAALFQERHHLVEPLPLPTVAAPTPVTHSKSRSNPGAAYSVYHQHHLSQLDLSRDSSSLVGMDTTTPTTPHSRKSSSAISIGPSGVFYDTQLPDHWSLRPDMQDLASSLTFNQSNSTDPGGHLEGRNHDGSGNGDEQPQNRLGILTVPGKKNSKVLRKKSLGRIRPKTAT